MSTLQVRQHLVGGAANLVGCRANLSQKHVTSTSHEKAVALTKAR